MKYIIDAVEDQNIPDLQCYMCKHFLSVKPILNNIQNGENICGRCMTSSSLFKHNLSFEILASQFIFPCMHANKGCAVKKPFEDIRNHENFCINRILKCYCSWSGNAFKLIRHYKKKHKELVFNDGDIVTTKNNFSCFLFLSQGLYFFVTLSYNINDAKLDIVGITNNSHLSNATFICTLLDSNADIKMELNKVTKLTCKDGLSTFSLKAKIPLEFIDSISRSIVCPNCSVQMTPPILRCSQGHLTCLQCTESWLDYCKACEIESSFICDSELETVAIDSIFTCRWNCGNKLGFFEIREHEQECTKRLYSCWNSINGCEWSGYLNELAKHGTNCILPVYNSEINHIFSLSVNESEVSFSGNAVSKVFHHRLIAFNNRFEIIYDTQDESTSVFVANHDIYSYGWFRYLAELKHLEDPNFPTKTYRLKHTYGGLYHAAISEDDILEFGKNRSFIITVQLIPLSEEERMVRTDIIYKRFKNYKRLFY